MSFLKIEKKSSGTYLRIAESFRENGKVRHRLLYSLGKVEDYTPEQLRSIGLKLYQAGGGDIKDILEGTIEEIDRFNFGFVQVFTQGLKHFGLDNFFRRIASKHKLSFNFHDACLLMLLERLNEPCSKRQNYVHQVEYIGLEPIYLQHLYRTLDRLAECSDKIQSHIYQSGRDLFNTELDVVFYDVTTLYFESQRPSDEENRTLRRKGFSKDGKIGDTQILFSLLIDKNKNPIGYEIFEGSSFEGHTFAQAVERLKKKYNIKKLIVVADRGMLNKDNMEVVVNADYEYIIGEKLRKLPDNLKDYFTDLKNYTRSFEIPDKEDPKKMLTIRYCTAQYNGRKIIGTFSSKRAQKDKYDRESRLQTAEKLLQKPELIDKKAAQFFLKKQSKNKYELDQQKIKNNERFDGFLAIATNATDITEQQAIDQYRQLYKIEQAFRVFKDYLQIRPMFHWTDKRIKGHICLCYIAYTLLNWLHKQLESKQIKLSENDLRHMLSHMQVSLIKHNDKKILLRSAIQNFEQKIIAALGIKPLPALIPFDKIEQYL